MAIERSFPTQIPLPFTLLDNISSADATQLVAHRVFTRSPVWQGLEAMAQAAALHQRFLCDFSQHAFLLSLDECQYPAVDTLNGSVCISAHLLGQTQRAAAYAMEALGPEGLWSLQLHIGLTPYDDIFKQQLLEPHYRSLFAWLTKNPLP